MRWEKGGNSSGEKKVKNARKAESNRCGANHLQVWSLHPTPVKLIRARDDSKMHLLYQAPPHTFCSNSFFL